MITYNHEKFIGQAIEGVIRQKIDFPMQLIIGDDASTDNTHTVVDSYLKKYPDKITYIRNVENLGMMRNFVNLYAMADAKYIAICEGDDYWCDEYKLKRQVDFMESNPEYAICFTNGYNIESSGNYAVLESNKFIDNRASGQIARIDLLKSNLLFTLTVFFRNYKIDFPAWFLTVELGDWALNILNSFYGSIWYMDEPTACYRKHVNGVYSSLSETNRLSNYLATGEIIRKNIGEPERSIMKEGQKERVIKLLQILKSQGNWKAYLLQLLKYSSLLPPMVLLKLLIKALLRIF